MRETLKEDWLRKQTLPRNFLRFADSNFTATLHLVNPFKSIGYVFLKMALPSKLQPPQEVELNLRRDKAATFDGGGRQPRDSRSCNLRQRRQAPSRASS